MFQYTASISTPVLLRNVRIEGRLTDIRFGTHIEALGRLQAQPGEEVRDGAGAELLPGLHDHHFHLGAYAAYRESLDLFSASSADEVLARLSATAADGWVRAVGYHEYRHGEISRQTLDAVPGPVRMQHRSGKFWVMNSAGLKALGLDTLDHPGVERDNDGEATGRLFRMDALINQRLGAQGPDLEAAAAQLRGWGVTAVTDASHTNDAERQQQLQALPVGVYCMGDATVGPGQFKVMLDEDALPEIETLVDGVRRAHGQDRGVAFHCVSRIELVFALSALKQAGHHAADRIEHGSLIGEDLFEPLRASGCLVATQPGFIAHRGEFFRAAVPEQERDDLYRFATLLDADIPVVASSDAPYGPANPWQVMHAAVTRETETGRLLGAREAISPERALAGYLTRPEDPAGATRSIRVGEPTNLCLLDRPWSEARKDLRQVQVVAVW